MKILFIMPNGFYARNFASVIESLARNRHMVLVALENPVDGAEDVPSAANSVLKSYLPEGFGKTVKVIRLRRQPSLLWGATSRQVAALWDYSRYLLPLHRQARRCAERAESFLLRPMRFLRLLPERRRDWMARVVAQGCAWIYEILPPGRWVVRNIRKHDPDLVLITPLVDLGSRQADYVKACRRLRIPIGHCVASWDNLTNKGLIKAIPDRVFVWNNSQKAEAVTLHGVPKERVVVTGAQLFDHWFEAKPTLNRAEFCAKVGLNPSKLVLLYTASSFFICDNEVDFVLRWLQALRDCDDASLREAGVLIRPHPKARKIFRQWDRPALRQFKDVVVFPRGDELSLARHGQEHYYNSLYHSAAVIGINTSAMVEASIVGRRSFTILLDELREGQDGMVHFQHLTREGLLGVARSFEEHVEQLRDALGGDDGRTKNFVESFLRPYGISQPATPVFVAEVEEMEDLAVEAANVRCRLGWIQRPVLLPFVAIVGLMHGMSRLGEGYWKARQLASRLLRWTGLLPRGPVIASALTGESATQRSHESVQPLSPAVELDSAIRGD